MSFLLLIAFIGCKKDSSTQQNISIPNGDFELWDNSSLLNAWQTNSCPVCVPPYETYIVKKVTDAHSGRFAAEFIYNNVYASSAINKFAISLHPSLLTGYIKSKIASGDSATIHVDLLSRGNVIDSGNLSGTSSIANYKKIEIPISQNSSIADSAIIKIVGGTKAGTELYVDDLVFLKTN